MSSSEHYKVSEQDQRRKLVLTAYNQYKEVYYGICLTILEDREAAGDALQDGFLKIFKNIQQYDPSKATFFTWCLNIIRNSAIDIVRKRKRKATVSLQQAAEIKTEIKENHLMNFELNRAIQCLDDHLKELIELTYLYGMTQVEVSEHLNVPLGTVKSRIRQAIQYLRNYWAEVELDHV